MAYKIYPKFNTFSAGQIEMIRAVSGDFTGIAAYDGTNWESPVTGTTTGETPVAGGIYGYVRTQGSVVPPIESEQPPPSPPPLQFFAVPPNISVSNPASSTLSVYFNNSTPAADSYDIYVKRSSYLPAPQIISGYDEVRRGAMSNYTNSFVVQNNQSYAFVVVAKKSGYEDVYSNVVVKTSL